MHFPFTDYENIPKNEKNNIKDEISTTTIINFKPIVNLNDSKLVQNTKKKKI